MGAFTVDEIEERVGSLEDQPVLVLGIAYRADVREDAFSSAFRLRDELLAAGARVYAHDPYFSDEHLRERGFEPYDLDDPQPVKVAIVQAPHQAYRDLGAGRAARPRAVRRRPQRARAGAVRRGRGRVPGHRSLAARDGGGSGGGGRPEGRPRRRPRRVGRPADL